MVFGVSNLQRKYKQTNITNVILWRKMMLFLKCIFHLPTPFLLFLSPSPFPFLSPFPNFPFSLLFLISLSPPFPLLFSIFSFSSYFSLFFPFHLSLSRCILYNSVHTSKHTIILMKTHTHAHRQVYT